jgi:hypothetical protein
MSSLTFFSNRVCSIIDTADTIPFFEYRVEIEFMFEKTLVRQKGPRTEHTGLSEEIQQGVLKMRMLKILTF